MSQLREAHRTLAERQKTAKGVSYYTRLVNRPLGRWCAAAAYVLRLTPDAVTVISAVVSAGGIALVMLVEPSPLIGTLAWFLLAFGFVLDSADGQLARLKAQSSPAGEWLDHTLDAGKLLLLHTGVLVGWYRFTDIDAGWYVVPLVFQVVAVVSFSALTAVSLMKRAATTTGRGPTPSGDDAATTPSTLRALLLLPGDFGVLSLVFVLWGFPDLFRSTYLLLTVLNVVLTIALLAKWRGELIDLGSD